MLASPAPRPAAGTAGFTAPRHRLSLLAWRDRVDEMVVFYVVALALLAAIVVPAWQAAVVTPVTERVVAAEPAARKSDRLLSPGIGLACSRTAYGNETPECLLAIAGQSGRERGGQARVISSGTAGNG